MKRGFQGLWASFEYLDDTCQAIMELRKAGFDQLCAQSPCPRHEIDYALGKKSSFIGLGALAGAIIGLICALGFMYYTTLDWVLPVSAKPIISILPMIPVIFEISILISAFIIFLIILYFLLSVAFDRNYPASESYFGYNRFLCDRYGVIINCQQADFQKVEVILTRNSAEEIFHEV